MQVIQVGDRFAIQQDDGTVARGRFHTETQANEWVLAQRVPHILRVIAGTATDDRNGRTYNRISGDFYAENERICRGTQV